MKKTISLTPLEQRALARLIRKSQGNQRRKPAKRKKVEPYAPVLVLGFWVMMFFLLVLGAWIASGNRLP